MWSFRKQKSATNLSASTDKLGCTLLSKRERPDRRGRLSDLWQMPNTAMDGCSGFSPDHLATSISNIQLALRVVIVCAIGAKGDYTQAITTKAAATLRRVAAAVFPQQKSHRSVLADPCVFPHLSSSSDLRILSSTQPSQVSPMTDFRQVWRLHAYSGGTVRDSHPVFYSLAALLPHPQALKRNIYLCRYYTRPNCRSQYPKQAS